MDKPKKQKTYRLTLTSCELEFLDHLVYCCSTLWDYDEFHENVKPLAQKLYDKIQVKRNPKNKDKVLIEGGGPDD